MQGSDGTFTIIQGGMGVGVSNWRLARAVAEAGAVGVVSGTALDAVLARRLQLGDPEGHLRRALAHFPWPAMAQRVLDAYWIPGGKPAEAPFRLVPMPTWPLSRHNVELVIVANFCEVWLAKEGHGGPVGINYLEKIQLPTLPSLLGAMLAGIDVILMGGGIPSAIPAVLDGLARGEAVELPLHVEGNGGSHSYALRLDPRELDPQGCPPLKRPRFLAIVSSDVVAKGLVRRANGYVDGFVVEDHTAGGHNAPPRRSDRAADAPPSFGPKDIPDLARIRELGRPFWVAGGCASPDRLREALEQGATGIQVGSAFALCEESGIVPELKRRILTQALAGRAHVGTDFRASPTGYPFKLMYAGELPVALDEPNERPRRCDLGYLRQPYVREDGELGYRCPGEPVESYVRKGGAPEETVGRQCLCNGLLATIGLAQVRPEGLEPPMVTSGEDLSFVPHLVRDGTLSYHARDVLAYLRSSGPDGAS